MKKTNVFYVLLSLVALTSLISFSACNENAIADGQNGNFQSKLNQDVTYPSGLYYTSTHEWIDIDMIDSTAIVGITDYAANDIGPVEGIQMKENISIIIGLPPRPPKKVDTTHKASGQKGIKWVLAPLSGEYDYTNPDVLESPVLVSTNPYTSGWIMKMKHVHIGDASYLMNSVQYASYIESLQ